MLLTSTALAKVESPNRTTGWIPLGTLGAGKGQVTVPDISRPFMPVPQADSGYRPNPPVTSSQTVPVQQLGAFGMVLLIAGAVGIFYFLRKVGK